MLRVIVVFGVATIAGLLVDATLIHGLFPSAVAPDFVLVLVVALAFHFRHAGGACGAFILGLIADFASGEFLGPNAAGCVVAFGLVVVISEKVYAERASAAILLGAAASSAKSLTFVLMLAMYLNVNVLSTHAAGVLLTEAVLSGLVTPVILKALDWTQYRYVNRPVQRRERVRWPVSAR